MAGPPAPVDSLLVHTLDGIHDQIRDLFKETNDARTRFEQSNQVDAALELRIAALENYKRYAEEQAKLRTSGREWVVATAIAALALAVSIVTLVAH